MLQALLLSDRLKTMLDVLLPWRKDIAWRRASIVRLAGVGVNSGRFVWLMAADAIVSGMAAMAWRQCRKEGAKTPRRSSMRRS